MTVYFGVDFHARVQTISYCNTADGEIFVRELHHRKDDIRGFYAQFEGEVIVGIEASGFSTWFEEILEALGHQVWLGNAAEIRRLAKRRQKNDRRDAELILDLLMFGGFPRVYRPSLQSREILRTLRHRRRLVKLRTMVKNHLHALAINAGLPRASLGSARGRQRLRAEPLHGVMAEQCQEWLALHEQLDARILPLEAGLQREAESDPQVVRLRTHPGIGVLTALALLHVLGPLARFANSRKVAAYVGLDPREHSSAEHKRYLGISKAGSSLLRFLLGQAALTAAGGDEELGRFYRRISFRRGHQIAKVAVARKLLVRSFILLRDEIDYAEFLRRGVEARLARQARRSNHT